MTAKSLKAKPVRKPAKPAKRKAPKTTAFARRRCEVAEIGHKQDKLSDAWRHQCHLWHNAETKEEKEHIKQICDSVIGTMRGGIERASQLQAYSADGACFQLLLIYSEIDCIRKNGDNFRHFDRLKRLCFSLRSYFTHALGVEAHRLAALHYMSGLECPRYGTEKALSEYERHLSDIAA